MKKVYIITPSAGHPVTEFVVSVDGLKDYVSDNGIMDEKAERPKFTIGENSLLPKVRTGLIKHALADNPDYILFVDDDMMFPANTLDYLMRWDKEIIGIAPITRSYKNFPKYCCVGMDGGPYDLKGKEGLQEVALLGLGLCLIKADIFHEMPEPWFNIEHNDLVGEYVGEDYFFFNKLRNIRREAGKDFNLWIDCDLSRKVSHMGKYPYNPAMIGG